MAITITCVPSAATLGVPYSETFVASGGTAPYSWFLNTGSFPPGLTLDSATGVLSGTPTQLGLFDYNIEVDDSAAGFAFKDCSITVSPVPGAYPTPYQVAPLDGNLAQWCPWDGGSFRGSNIQIPPFRFGGYTYVCYQNLAGLDANLCGTPSGDFISVSSSPDEQNFTIVDQGNAPQISEVTWQAYWIEDFANNRVWAVYQDFTTNAFTIIPFNLAAGGLGSWGTPIGGGPVLAPMNVGSNMPILVATMPVPDTFQVTFVENVSLVGSGGWSVKTVQCVAGVWGSPLTLITGGTGTPPSIQGFICGTCADAAGVTWIFDGYRTLTTGVQKMLCHRIATDGTLLEETVIATANKSPFGPTLPFAQSVPKYLAATDEIVYPAYVYIPSDWTPPPPMHACLIISPASAPSFTFDGITDYFFDTLASDNGPPYFFFPPDESRYYVGFCNRRDFGNAGPIDEGWEQILFWSRLPGDPSWTGPTIFWDNEANQLLVPTYHVDDNCPLPGDVLPPAELNSLAISIDALGAVRLTCGMLDDYCGVEFYLSSGTTPPDEPTVTFGKTVVGGSAVDTDFTLVLTGHGSPPLIFGATPGHHITVPAGPYDLTETGPTGYTVVYHHSGGGTLVNDTLTVADGDDATITAVNTQGGQPEASCGMGAGGAPVGASPVGCFELLRVVATFRPARHLPVRGSNR